MPSRASKARVPASTWFASHEEDSFSGIATAEMWQPMIFLPAPLPGIISADAAGATDVKTRALAIALMMPCLFAQAARAETREEINQARRDLADDLEQCLVLFYAA